MIDNKYKLYAFLAFFISFLYGTTLSSQPGTLNLSEADPSNYPNVSCYLSMFDGNGKSVGNLDVGEFSVFENGIQVPSNAITLQCTNLLPMNVVVVLDKSTSMGYATSNGETRWEWAKQGAKSFIQKLHLNDTIQCAITTFSSIANITCNFTKDTKELSDSLDMIKNVYGNTNFNVAFLNKVNGAIDLLKTRSPNIRRVIVFLSDGKHEAQTEPLKYDEIISSLKNANIQLFAISLLSDGPVLDLSNIASATGGDYFNVDTKLGLESIYSTIASKLDQIFQCKLTWIAPKLCDSASIYRVANINFSRLDKRYTRTYVAPADHVVRVTTDEPEYDFGDPAIDNFTERTITMTAENQDLVINDINVIPDTYFEITDYGNGSSQKPNFPIILQKSTSRSFKVKFTQLDEKKLRQATLVISADPCPREIPLIGGIERITIKTPKQEDIYTSCDSVAISWDGVSKDRLVDIYYSNVDSINSVVKIADSVKGLLYKWRNDFANGAYRIIAKTTPINEFLWAKNLGSSQNDGGESVTISPNKLYAYVTGYINGDADFSGMEGKSIGQKDIYIAKFDMDGNPLWVHICGSPLKDDLPGGVTTDNSGNIYMTGTTFRGSTFAGLTPGFLNDNMEYMFLAKFDPSGKLLNYTYLGSDQGNPDFKTWGKRVRYNFDKNVGGLIYVDMDYTGGYYDPLTQFGLATVTTRTKVTAVYDIALNLVDMNYTYPNYPDYSSKIFYDTANINTLETGEFTGSKTFGDLAINSFGNSDAFLSRYGAIPNSADTSEVFYISKPVLKFTLNKLNFGSCKWGSDITKDFEYVLRNYSRVPITIDSFTITSVSSVMDKDFEVLSNLQGAVIDAGDSLTIQMKFTPGYTGDRNATLNLYSTCGFLTAIPLYGFGTCGGEPIPEVDFGSLNIGKEKTDTIFCIYKNTSNLDVIVAPRLTGLNWSDFSFKIPDYITVKNGKIRLNPGECLDLIVTFTPTELGERTCEINYQVETPCLAASTTLKGIGTSSDISVTSYNWGEKRIFTNSDGEISIINNSINVEQIDSIKFELPESTNIFSIDLPAFPLKVEPNSKTPISVHFKPGNEINYNSRVIFYVKDRKDPLYSTLAGIGILPKLNAVWVCGETVNVGDSTISYLELTNPSKSSDLYVKSVDFVSLSPEYTWIDSAPRDTVIHKEETVKFFVMFKPMAGSDHQNIISILADNYDGTFPDEWRETRVSTDCDGINLTYTTPIDFKSNLICDNVPSEIRIKNNSTAQDVTLYKDYEISGDDEAFTITLDKDQIIPPGEAVQIPVKFTPKEAKSYSATVTFNTSAGIEIIIGLLGTGNRIVPSSEKFAYQTDAGKYFDYTVAAEFPDLEKPMLTDFNVTLQFDPKVINFLENTFRAELPATSVSGDYIQWFQPVRESSGIISIQGTGSINVPSKLKLFSIQGLALLSLERTTNVIATIDYGCRKIADTISKIDINPYCLNDGRIVDISSTEFFMKTPAPNPSKGITSIDFGVGFDCNVRIDIYNVIGELIETPLNMDMKTGGYSVPVNTAALPSGVYYIIYRAGYFSSKEILTVE